MALYPDDISVDFARGGGGGGGSRKRKHRTGRAGDLGGEDDDDDNEGGRVGKRKLEVVDFHLSDDFANAPAPDPEVELDPIPFKRIRDKQELADQRCFGCEERIGSRTFPRAKKLYYALAELCAKLEQQAGTREPRYAQIAKFHANQFVPQKLKAGDPCIAWPVELVRAHFESHVRSSRTNVLEAQRTVVTMMEEIKDLFLEEDKESGKKRVNTKNAELLLKCATTLKGLCTGSASALFR